MKIEFNKLNYKCLLILLCLFVGLTSFAEEDEDENSEAQAPLVQTSITVLPSLDSSGFNMEEPTQQALGQLYFQSGRFKVQFSSYTLTGFTEEDLNQTFQRLETEQVSFAYIEDQRLSLFFFDSGHKTEYIAISIPYTSLANSGNQAGQIVQYYLQEAVQQALYQFEQGQFQPLPGAEKDRTIAEGDSPKARASVSKALYKEYAETFKESKSFYLGADIGVARFAAGGDSSSTVNLGIFGGKKMGPKLSVELGLDIFSYLVASARVSYHLSILKEKYVSLSLNGSVGMVQASLTENLGFERTNLKNGALLFGPGVRIEIPLLGAQVVAGVRMFVGGASVILANYGLVYPL